MKNGKSYVNQSEIWFPIDLCFKLAYTSKTLAHDPALNLYFYFQAKEFVGLEEYLANKFTVKMKFVGFGGAHKLPFIGTNHLFHYIFSLT